VVYGFVDLPEDIGRSMLAGLIIAAVITAIIPPDFFTGVLSGGIVAMLMMMALGIPMYVCATASVPIAAALIARGVSPGVALVFLMTGPATNAATIATVWRTMGKKTAVLYLASVAGTALASGLTLDYFFFTATGVQHQHEMGRMSPGAVSTVLAIILLAVLIVGAVRSYLPRNKHVASPKDILAMETNPCIELRIGGMTCNHCRMAVERALAEVHGSEAVDVDLHAGQAVVAGAARPEELVKAVESIGYTAEVLAKAPGDQAV
jgi:copper chaperone CopZ